MTPYFTQKAPQSENRWLSHRLPSLLAAVSLVATVAPANLAAASECQGTDLTEAGTIQRLTSWKGTTFSTVSLTMTVMRDIHGQLIPSPALAVASYMKSSRLVLGKSENRGMATIGVCSSRYIRKSAPFNHAMFRSIVKNPAKAHTQFMNVPVLLYNGKRQGLTIRTTPPEIRISARYKADTLIGPVQEIRKSVLSDNRSVSQAVATLPSTVESSSLFGGQPSVAVNPFQSALQLPSNESLRLNMTTAEALHGGNCASGCP